MKVFRLGGLHNKLAQSVCPPGTYRTLGCRACNTTKKVGPNGIAKYLRKGWPTCCERTMELL